MYSQFLSMTLNTIKDTNSYNRLNRMDNNQEITSRLKFIGKIKKSEKINTRYMFVQQTGLTTSLTRTFFHQDNRSNTLNFIQETISRAFELLITYERSENDSDKILSSHLLRDLSNCCSGLTNLKATYIDDTKFCCDMDTLLEVVTARLEEMSSKIDLNNIDTNTNNDQQS